MEQMTEAEASAFLAQANVAHLAVIAEGEPYVSPMSFVVLDGQIHFRTVAGRRLNALRSDPRVSIEVSDFDAAGGDWKSVIVGGEAHEIEDEALAQRVLQGLYDKYREALGSPLGRGGLETSIPIVVGVEIFEMTGMKSSGALGPRTRPGRL